MPDAGKRSRFRSVARWALPAILIAALAPAWVLYLSGGDRAIMGWVLLISAGQLLAPFSLVVLLIHTVRKRRFSRPMQATFGLAAVALWPGLWGVGLLTVAFPFDLETSKPAATVRLPSNERLRVAWGGDRVATNYHAAFPDQRWAYDLLVEPAMHGSDRLEDYGCFGTPVVAPISARVLHARDGAPDEIPGKASLNRENPVGNTVMLELETGTYLVIAHLKQGSVGVREGDRVAEGQKIGECGNSGNTSEPHIHIHHQRQDPRKRRINLAEGLPLYFRDHDGDPMPEGGLAKRDGKLAPVGAIVQHAGAGAEGPADAGLPTSDGAANGGMAGSNP